MKKPRSFDINTVLDRMHNRREFLKLFGKGLGYSALASTLPACGGGSSGGSKGGVDDIGDIGDVGDPLQPAQPPVIPQASPAYTVLKRTTFGIHRDELAAIETMGVGLRTTRRKTSADQLRDFLARTDDFAAAMPSDYTDGRGRAVQAIESAAHELSGK